MTLHEAIEQILTEKSSAMTTSEIAEVLNQRKLYHKKDGSLITAYQVHGRTKNYPHLFTRQDSLVDLLNRVNKQYPENMAKQNFDFVHDNIQEYKNVSSIESLKENSFQFLGTVGTISSEGLPDFKFLKNCGVYAIAAPTDYQPVFIDVEEAKKNKNVLKPWSVELLKQKWVNDADILYYGLAGRDTFRSLNDRLDDLIEHCKGNTTDRGPHKGGEIIWQSMGYEEFLLWAKPTGEPPEPRNHEFSLLELFIKETGKLPFANRQR